MTRTTDEELDGIAIIGMSGRFPGARDLDQFWKNLRDGVESITFFPDAELVQAGVDPEALRTPGYVKASPVLEGIDRFDASFFGVSPGEARVLDPQHRLLLETAWSTMEDAAYDAESYPGIIGAFFTGGESGYLWTHVLEGRSPTERGHAGLHMAFMSAYFSNARDFLSTRVSYKLNLRGPSLTVQAACASSLVAIHLACQSLVAGECDMALAGGSTLKIPHGRGHFYEEGSILSPDGHCRPFDAEAQGTIFGSGVAVVLLKRLADAHRDGDRIRAVIRGSAINNDGSLKMGYTAPSVDAQARAVSDALFLAGVSADSIGYVECHGTATNLGDPIEIAALTQAFRADTQAQQFCAIGSVKSNIGHLDHLAGIAGLIKTTLALEHRAIPASLHFRRPNPQIDFERSPFFVNTTLRDWTSGDEPRRAGVTSVGAGGTNVHVVLEEAPERNAESVPEPFKLLTLSGHTEADLERVTERLAAHLAAHPEIDVNDAAYTLQIGRKPLTHRRIAVVRDAGDAADVLTARDPRRLASGRSSAEVPGVVFMFPGQGAQYVGMGRALYERNGVFREHFDACCDLVRPHVRTDLRELLYPSRLSDEDSEARLRATESAQPALFALEYALARQWMAWGVQPGAMIGHSVGEWVAACLAGVVSLPDALSIVAVRGRLVQALASGSMLSVPLREDELAPLLGEGLEIAAINEPARCVVSGPDAPIAALELRLRERFASSGTDATTRRLHTSHAFHSAMMDPAVAPFLAVLRRVTFSEPRIPFVSNVTGTWITDAEATSPEYWAAHLRRPVLFSKGIREILRRAPSVLLEVGPGRVLSTFAIRHLEKTMGHGVVASLGDAASESALTAVGKVWLAGVSVDWAAVHAGHGRRRIGLPTYPFAGPRHWIDDPPAPEPEVHSASPGGEPRTESEKTLARIWQSLLGVERIGLDDNFFELGGDSVIGVQIAARAEKAGLRITPKQLFDHATIRTLAEIARPTGVLPAEQGPLVGPVPTTPAMRRMLEAYDDASRFKNLPLHLDWREPPNVRVLEETLRHLALHHDALRMRLRLLDGTLQLYYAESAEAAWSPALEHVDVSHCSEAEQSAIARQVETSLARDLMTPDSPMVRAVLFDRGRVAPHRLTFVFNHLIADIAAQGILVEDLEALYARLAAGRPPELPPKTTSFRAWVEQISAPESRGSARPTFDRAERHSVVVSFSLDADETRALVEVQKMHHTRIEVLLLAAAVRAFQRWTGERRIAFDLEGEGREVALPGVDVSRTFGWFTTLFPMVFELGSDHDPMRDVKALKEQVATIAREGIGHGLLDAPNDPRPETLFVYLGPNTDVESRLFLRPSQDGLAEYFAGFRPDHYRLLITSHMAHGGLEVLFTYDTQRFDAGAIETLASLFGSSLRAIFAARAADAAAAASPVDFPGADLTDADLADLLDEFQAK
ncbi:acyltransferase domain-containing protein [Pendulispora rubella]|uniref:Acyltransferase domain-containing protein n=1 Tax=Pendulispora rubella TaxID=2741070 RepID=A0ABZ2LK96_9BACT